MPISQLQFIEAFTRRIQRNADDSIVEGDNDTAKLLNQFAMEISAIPSNLSERGIDLTSEVLRAAVHKETAMKFIHAYVAGRKQVSGIRRSTEKNAFLKAIEDAIIHAIDIPIKAGDATKRENYFLRSNATYTKFEKEFLANIKDPAIVMATFMNLLEAFRSGVMAKGTPLYKIKIDEVTNLMKVASRFSLEGIQSWNLITNVQRLPEFVITTSGGISTVKETAFKTKVTGLMDNPGVVDAINTFLEYVHRKNANTEAQKQRKLVEADGGNREYSSKTSSSSERSQTYRSPYDESIVGDHYAPEVPAVAHPSAPPIAPPVTTPQQMESPPDAPPMAPPIAPPMIEGKSQAKPAVAKKSEKAAASDSLTFGSADFLKELQAKKLKKAEENKSEESKTKEKVTHEEKSTGPSLFGSNDFAKALKGVKLKNTSERTLAENKPEEHKPKEGNKAQVASKVATAPTVDLKEILAKSLASRHASLNLKVTTKKAKKTDDDWDDSPSPNSFKKK